MTDLLVGIFLLQLIFLAPFFLGLRFFTLKTAGVFLLLGLSSFFLSPRFGNSGAAIVCETEGSARQAGLKSGVVLAQIDGKPINTKAEAESILLSLSGGAAEISVAGGKNSAKVSLPEWQTPWWWARVEGEALDRFGGLSFTCRPPVARASPASRLRLQRNEFGPLSRVREFAGKPTASRRDLEISVQALGPNGVAGLRFTSSTRLENLWVMRGWVGGESEALAGLGIPSGPVIYRSRALSGLGDPARPGNLPLHSVNGSDVFSALPLATLQGKIETLRVAVPARDEKFSDYKDSGIVLQPQLVEGVGYGGYPLLEPLRFLWRQTFAPGFSFFGLIRELSSLPGAWYEIASDAPFTIGYWLFRLGCICTILAAAAAIGSRVRRLREGGQKRKLLVLSVVGVLLLARDLFLLWVF